MEFTRKVRLTEYFYGSENDRDESFVRNKSNFIPPKGRDKDLELFISNITEIPLTPTQKANVKHNLPKSQHNSIRSLTDDKNIIIKQADKGGCHSHYGKIILQNTNRKNAFRYRLLF